jgi:hypothetical protein
MGLIRSNDPLPGGEIWHSASVKPFWFRSTSFMPPLFDSICVNCDMHCTAAAYGSFLFSASPCCQTCQSIFPLVLLLSHRVLQAGFFNGGARSWSFLFLSIELLEAVGASAYGACRISAL